MLIIYFKLLLIFIKNVHFYHDIFNPFEEGLICVLSTLEMGPCIEIKKHKETQKLELKNGQRKCLHYYFYYLDKEFGFMHVKLQSWFPFAVQVYVNGREYISKQLDKARISYKRYNNCFTQIDDIEAAQKISDNFTGKKLDGMLNYFAKQVNPFIERIKEILGHDYYHRIQNSGFRIQHELTEIF